MELLAIQHYLIQSARILSCGDPYLSEQSRTFLFFDDPAEFWGDEVSRLRLDEPTCTVVSEMGWFSGGKKITEKKLTESSNNFKGIKLQRALDGKDGKLTFPFPSEPAA